ncbi:copper chaperone PCu(A)C [Phenylobacterium sp.]|uniref:copper chaperone PCu(A)C n=1 Tax=Phenylobacterium sp. TaxID=1871053 RepID=UPI002B80C2FE|nr:copper chaperone PCu(A)C [Phenylobacterium sp.]HVI31145.1 copper chaperone PCu(A)C [Phenylobacterium sp.]
MRALLTALALAAAPAAAAAAAATSIEVSQAWSRPAVAGGTGAGFLTLTNRGKAPDALTGAESPVARKVEIHRTTMAGGVMKMGKVERVPVPPGGKVILAPGGHHLMLFGLTKALNAGDRVPATLSFASGTKVKVELVVGTGAGAPAMDHSHH